MADTILSPIPYNAGSMVLNGSTFDFCYLGSGKFMHVVGQSNPGFIYAYISNNTNLKTGTFSSVVPTMRAILSGSNVPATLSSMRIVKLAANRAALAVNGKVFVLEADVNDDITVKTGTYQTAATLANAPNVTTVPTTLATTYGVTSANSGQGTGSLFQMFYARDNVLYMAERVYNNANGNFSVAMKKIVYNPTDQSLNYISNLFTYTPSGSNLGPTSFTRVYCQDIPGSTSKLISVRAHVTSTSSTASLNTSTIAVAYVVDSSDISSMLTAPVPAGVQTLCPMSPTTILGFVNSKSYFTYTASAWNAAAAVFSASGSTTAGGGTVVQSEALDANYFILWTLTGTELVSSNTFYTRVGRFVDGAFGQVSTGTAGNDGVGFSLVALHPDNTFIVRDGTDAFYALGRSSISTFTPFLRVIYQAGG